MAEGSGLSFTDTVSGIALSTRARLLIFVVLAALIGATLAMIYFGVTDDARLGGWVEAATYLLGILFPALLIIAVLTLAEGGDAVVQNRTYAYMTGTLPRILQSIEETAELPVPFGSLRRRSVQSSVQISVHQFHGSCLARYGVKLADGRFLRFRLELNIRKANIVLLFPEPPGSHPSNTDAMARLRETFPHSLAGAELEGFKVNSVVGQQLIDGTPATGLVLIRMLDPKFITSPYERVYFAQDLMFFLKSVLNESPESFPPLKAAE